ARIDDTLYLHGSTGSGPLLALKRGGPVCVAVTVLDGLVLARSQFHHSTNYRSVVVHGDAVVVADEATRRRAFDALIDKVGPGRSRDTGPPTRKELAQTAVLAVPLVEVSVKARTGSVSEEPEDHGLPYWAGIVPVRTVRGVPRPDAGVSRAVPDYLREHRS